MASSIVKGYVDDYYKKINVNQTKKSLEVKDLAVSDVKSILEGIIEDNKTTVKPDFK